MTTKSVTFSCVQTPGCRPPGPDRRVNKCTLVRVCDTAAMIGVERVRVYKKIDAERRERDERN